MSHPVRRCVLSAGTVVLDEADRSWSTSWVFAVIHGFGIARAGARTRSPRFRVGSSGQMNYTGDRGPTC